MVKRSHYLQCTGEDWEKARMCCLVRDNFQCQILGCTETRLRFLQVHHKQWRIHGGTHDLDNLITLCRLHHIQQHPHMQWVLVADDPVVEYPWKEL